MAHRIFKIFGAAVVMISVALGAFASRASLVYAQANYPTSPSAQGQCNGPWTGVAPAGQLVGAVISSIDANSPAAQAGLKEDEVILSVNGQAFPQGGTLDQALASMQPGASVTLNVSAAGEPPTNVQVTLGASSSNPSAPYLGVTTEMTLVEGGPFYYANASANCQSPAFEFPEAYEMGMMVSDISSNGPAAAAGLQQGDLVMAANGQPLGAPYDLTGMLQSAKPGDGITLSTYLLNGQLTDIKVTLAADPQNASQAFLGITLAPIVEGPEANPENAEGQQQAPVYASPPIYPVQPAYPTTPYYYGAPYYYGIPYYGGRGEEFWEQFGSRNSCVQDGDHDLDDSNLVCGKGGGNDVEKLVCANDGDHDLDDSNALCGNNGGGNDVEKLVCANDGDHDLDDSNALCSNNGGGNDVEKLVCANDGDHDLDDSNALCGNNGGNDVEKLVCANDGDHDLDDSDALCKNKGGNEGGNGGNSDPEAFVCANDGDHDLDDSSVLCHDNQKPEFTNPLQKGNNGNNGNFFVLPTQQSNGNNGNNGNKPRSFFVIPPSNNSNNGNNGNFFVLPTQQSKGNNGNDGNNGNKPRTFFVIPPTNNGNNGNNGNNLNDNTRRFFLQPPSGGDNNPIVCPEGVLKNGVCVPVMPKKP